MYAYLSYEGLKGRFLGLDSTAQLSRHYNGCNSSGNSGGNGNNCDFIALTTHDRQNKKYRKKAYKKKTSSPSNSDFELYIYYKSYSGWFKGYTWKQCKKLKKNQEKRDQQMKSALA